MTAPLLYCVWVGLGSAAWWADHAMYWGLRAC